MKIEMDRGNDVLYIQVREEGDVERTVDLSPGVFADLNAAGELVGIEAISLAAFEAFMKNDDLPTDLMTWLRVESDLRQKLGGAV